MLRNIDSKGREWITRTLTDGRSYQCTRINNRWYKQGHFASGSRPALRELYGDTGILDDCGDLFYVLIPVETR